MLKERASDLETYPISSLALHESSFSLFASGSDEDDGAPQAGHAAHGAQVLVAQL